MLGLPVAQRWGNLGRVGGRLRRRQAMDGDRSHRWARAQSDIRGVEHVEQPFPPEHLLTLDRWRAELSGSHVHPRLADLGDARRRAGRHLVPGGDDRSRRPDLRFALDQCAESRGGADVHDRVAEPRWSGSNRGAEPRRVARPALDRGRSLDRPEIGVGLRPGLRPDRDRSARRALHPQHRRWANLEHAGASQRRRDREPRLPVVRHHVGIAQWSDRCRLERHPRLRRQHAERALLLVLERWRRDVVAQRAGKPGLGQQGRVAEAEQDRRLLPHDLARPGSRSGLGRDLQRRARRLPPAHSGEHGGGGRRPDGSLAARPKPAQPIHLIDRDPLRGARRGRTREARGVRRLRTTRDQGGRWLRGGRDAERSLGGDR